ncbi:MAG: hypothetical protein RL701_3903, partial [Pseudomonadota bacterium]
NVVTGCAKRGTSAAHGGIRIFAPTLRALRFAVFAAAYARIFEDVGSPNLRVACA